MLKFQIGLAVTSRGNPKPREGLFETFVQSFADTVCDCPGMSFHVYFGYDHDDPLYGQAGRREAILADMRAVFRPLPVRVVPVRLEGLAHKVCRIWGVLAEAGYRDGCDYYLWAGDDVTFLDPRWPAEAPWSSAPYAQREYLDLLAHARLGLCLPGFGPKCNREIELLALGVVPVITPGVCTTYYRPLGEGVHYFRAESPEDARRIIRSCSPSRWEAMSQAGRAWYQANCSVRGSFETTIHIARQFPSRRVPCPP